MIARLTTIAEHQTSTVRYAPSAAEAARSLDVSESTIRRTARQLGVKSIAGDGVAGFVRFSSDPVDVSMPYSSAYAEQRHWLD